MSECKCEVCVNACKRKPGWFMPGEAERVAEFLGMTLDELFQQYLMVDYWFRGDGGQDSIFILSPAIKGGRPGTEFPYSPYGKCMFLRDDGLCAIHPVKPHECCEMMHSDSHEMSQERHEGIAMAWDAKQHQVQITMLLGRHPETPPMTIMAVLDMLRDLADMMDGATQST